MRQMIDFRDYLIEKFSDIDKALSYLEVALEEYEKDPDGAALYYGFSAAIEAQGGVQKFALKTHSTPQAVSDALLSKNETQIAELLKKQVLAKRGEDKDIARNETLPKGWREVRLNNVASVKTGPFGTQLHQRDYVQSNGTPIVTVEHLSESGLIHKNLPLVSHHDKQRLRQYLIQEGDIVFSRVGSVDRSALVSKDEDGWLFSGRLLRVRPQKGDVYSSYLNYFFHTRKFRHYMKSIAVGGTMPSINTSILSNVIIHLPPVDQQKAIASLLEKWDIAIEKTEALIATKEKQFKWLLKTLISDQQDNPEWREVKLGELCSDIAYGYTATASNEPIGPKFLRITDIVSDSINWESVPYCEIEDSKKHRYTLETGDIVIARTGATTGYNQVVRSNEHSVFASYLIRYKLRQDIAYPFFIGCVLKSTYWKRFVERIKARSAQPGANAKDFASFKIFLPTFPEQKRIANILDTAKKEVESLNQLAEQYRTNGKWQQRT